MYIAIFLSIADIDVDYVTYLFMSAIVVDLVVENVRCRNCVDLLVTSRIIYPFSADSYCGEFTDVFFFARQYMRFVW